MLPDVRHQRRIAAGRQRVRCDARQRPLQCAARTLFQGAHQLRLSQDDLQGRDRVCRRDARDYCQRPRLACDRKPRDVQQHLRRRGLRCDTRADRMDAARLRRFGLGRAAGDDPAREVGFPRRRTRAGDGRVPRGLDPQDPPRQMALRHGPELLGDGAAGSPRQTRAERAAQHHRAVQFRVRLDYRMRRLPR